MIKKLLLLTIGLFSINGFSQNSLAETFPDTYYYDGLNYSFIFKKGIGLYLPTKWESSNLVFDYQKDSYSRTYVDVRSVSWKFEYENDTYGGSKELSDTLYRNRGINGAPDSEEYYALIPYKKYIAHYNLVDEKVVLKHVYCQDKNTAKAFTDSALVVSLIENVEKKILIEIEEGIQAGIKKQEERLNGRELPKAKQTDSKLEAKLLAAIQEHGEAYGWSETFTQVIITSDWWFSTNKYSGRVVSKSVEIAAIAKWESGKCTYQLFNITQDVTDNSGKSFGKMYRSGTGSQYQIRCDKVK